MLRQEEGSGKEKTKDDDEELISRGHKKETKEGKGLRKIQPR